MCFEGRDTSQEDANMYKNMAVAAVFPLFFLSIYIRFVLSSNILKGSLPMHSDHHEILFHSVLEIIT
jgi:hypothetical protein